MLIDEELCPLITDYTRTQKISDDLLEQLYVLRNWDIDGVKAGTVKPIPFKWPSTLRKQIMFQGKLTDLNIREYQKQQIHHMCRMPRFINGDAVGLGKTLDTIASMCWLKERKPDLKFIILTTKSTSFQWASETEYFSELRPFVIQDKYRGNKSYEARLQQVRDFIAGDKKDVLICKYTSLIGSRKKTTEQFDDDGNPVSEGREQVSAETREFCSIMRQNRGRIVLVLDECQKFKSLDSQIRKLVSGAASCSGRVWALSATVIKNDLKEFYSIAHAIGIRPFGSVWEWEHEFAVLTEQYVGNGQTKTTIRGYIPAKIVEFKAGMRPFFLGRSQRQVKEPLPQLTTVYHPIELDEKQAKLLLQDIPSGAYQLPPSVVRQAGEIIVRERDPDNKMTMLAVYQLVANHPCLLDPSDRKEFFTKKLSPKEEALLDLLDGDLRGEKVIVFTKSRTWIDRFQRLTADGNFSTRKFLRITGNENEKQREENKKLFQTTPDHDVIYINSAALEGVNLQQAAHMIMLDCPWSWGDLLQLVGRMVRMASPHSACTLHVLTAKGTIDEYTLEVLRTKKNIFECILGESHSSGILGGVTLNLGSGMEEVGSEEEFASLLKAHMRSVSMGTFIQGEKLTEAIQEGENYVMAHETKKVRKPKKDFKLTDFSKWDIEG
jgi:SNF2 family DNA or RNA helicase